MFVGQRSTHFSFFPFISNILFGCFYYQWLLRFSCCSIIWLTVDGVFDLSHSSHSKSMLRENNMRCKCLWIDFSVLLSYQSKRTHQEYCYKVINNERIPDMVSVSQALRQQPYNIHFTLAMWNQCKVIPLFTIGEQQTIEE